MSLADIRKVVFQIDETHKEMEDRSKYNSIMAMIDENEDIEDIYKEFTLEELFYLGW